MLLTHIKHLGSGGFGNVDLVVDESGQQFARKTFSVNQPLDAELIENVRKRFVREARMQSGVDHRNVVPILGHELSGSSPWYLMPVAITSLDKEISADRTIGGTFKSVISDIVAGLDELHTMQMFHRDLKPQNVLKFIDKKNGDFYYAISDFGFVSLKDSRLSNLTYTGMKLGADYYTAPEITRNLSSATSKADIYSLGCIIHDLVGVEDRVPCGEIRETSEYSGLLLNCTRQKPDRRFKSVLAVRDVFLAIDTSAPSVVSQQAVDLAERLESENALTAMELRALADFIEDNNFNSDAVALLRKISSDKIADFWACDPDSTKKIGLSFCEWASEPGRFDFDFCDVLCDRLIAFIALAPIDLQAEALNALLILGTSHNRWYVERRFMSLCGPSMDEQLAKRLAVEFRAGGKDTCEMIESLEAAIGRHRSELHPILGEAIQGASQ